MNELVKKPAALPAELIAKLVGGISRTAGGGGRLGGVTLLKMSTAGVFQLGQANDLVQKGSRWLVNIRTFRHGYVCWIDSKIAGEVMVAGAEDLPPMPAPINGTPFKLQTSVELRCMTGQDAGTQVLYKPSSLGGTEATKDLSEKIRDRAEFKPGNPYIFPVLELESYSYPGKKAGGNPVFNPSLNIVNWASEDGQIEEEYEEDEVVDDVVPPPPLQAKPKAEKPPLNNPPQGQRRRPKSS